MARSTKQRKPRRKTAAPPRPPVRPVLIMLALLVLVVVSGVQVADQAHEVRRLHAELEELGKHNDALLAEQTRLRLERGARASFAHVEQQAMERLDMHFPERLVTLQETGASNTRAGQ